MGSINCLMWMYGIELMCIWVDVLVWMKCVRVSEVGMRLHADIGLGLLLVCRFLMIELVEIASKSM